VGRASRPSFLFPALTGETPIPLFGNPPKFPRSENNISSNELFPVLDAAGFILLPVRNKAKSALPKAMCRSLSTHLTEESFNE